jgi:hypothetical protein
MQLRSNLSAMTQVFRILHHQPPNNEGTGYKSFLFATSARKYRLGIQGQFNSAGAPTAPSDVTAQKARFAEKRVFITPAIASLHRQTRTNFFKKPK